MQFPSPSETFACNDVKTLRNLGVSVSVYSMKPNHPQSLKLKENFTLTDIPTESTGRKETFIGLLKMFLHPFKALKMFIWLTKNDINKFHYWIRCIALMPACFYIFNKLKKENPDIVHLFWGHYPSMVAYLVLTYMPKVEITTFLGAYDLEMRLGISKNIAERAKTIFTHSYVNVPLLEELGFDASKIRVIHRGVNVQELSNLVDKSPKDNNKWITAGRLIKEKQFDKVIELFSDIVKIKNNLELHIFGDGPEKENLRKLAQKLSISDKVHFRGFCSQHILVKKMAKSEVFLFLSAKPGERLPNVIKEAMFARCVCISYYSPGIEELIDNGESGFIVYDYNIIGIIKGLLEYKLPVDVIQNNAHESIKTRFDIRSKMAAYINEWQR